jgi:hypothetical protein
MKAKQESPGSFMLKALELLNDPKVDLLEIHKGSQLPFYWLREMKAGRIRNPSVNRVQKLVEHLTKRPLTF